MASNDQNHNHNGNNIENEPPKKKYKRTHESYDKFLEIINKVSNDHGTALFTCLEWKVDVGVTCKCCCDDKTIKGPFAAEPPCTNFNYSN